MNIIKDDGMISLYGEPPKRDISKISEIVIHHTAGEGGWSALKKWMTSPVCERKEQYKKFIGFAHYYIEKQGNIYQPYSDEYWMYHSCSGKHDKKTIGIEICHLSGKFTDNQYASLIELIENIYQTCAIQDIVSHDYNYKKYSNKTKGCPGENFEWEILRAGLKSKNIEPRFYE